MTNSETAHHDAESSAKPKPGLIARITTPAIAWALSRRPVRAALLYSERRGPMLADSVTYRALFSVFAGVLLGFSIAALWLAGNPDAWRAIIQAVQSAVPGLIGKDGAINPEDLKAPHRSPSRASSRSSPSSEPLWERSALSAPPCG